MFCWARRSTGRVWNRKRSDIYIYTVVGAETAWKLWTNSHLDLLILGEFQSMICAISIHMAQILNKPLTGIRGHIFPPGKSNVQCPMVWAIVPPGKSNVQCTSPCRGRLCQSCRAKFYESEIRRILKNTQHTKPLYSAHKMARSM